MFLKRGDRAIARNAYGADFGGFVYAGAHGTIHFPSISLSCGHELAHEARTFHGYNPPESASFAFLAIALDGRRKREVLTLRHPRRATDFMEPNIGLALCGQFLT